jgi:hypothetical protein
MLSLKDLLEAGVLVTGQKLKWERLKTSEVHTATLLADGTLQTSDGKIHRSPSTAAAHLGRGISTNGWRVWRISTGVSIWELRNEEMAKRVD